MIENQNEMTKKDAKSSEALTVEPPTVVSSVGKAFRVLALFGQNRRKMTLTQIATEAHMDLSSAQRFVNTLVFLKYLQKDHELRLYSLAPRVLELGYRYVQSNDFLERAVPHLQQLNVDTGETVNLSVLDGDDIIIVSRLAGRYVLRPEIAVGARLPAFLTSSGHVLLSQLNDDDLSKRLQTSNFAEMINVETIIQQCEQIRLRGYSCISNGYFTNDITLAAPIFNAEGKPHAALSISISKIRWSVERAEKELVPQLLDATVSISVTKSPIVKFN